MEKPTRELVNTFLEWFRHHPHSAQEDRYAGTLTLENLSQMDRQQFTEFFYQFAYDGGHVQTGGHRTASRFRATIEANEGIPTTVVWLPIEVMKPHITDALKPYGLTVHRKRTANRRLLQLTSITQ